MSGCFPKGKEGGALESWCSMVKAAGGCLLTEGVVMVLQQGWWEIVSRSGLGGADATGVCLHWWQ